MKFKYLRWQVGHLGTSVEMKLASQLQHRGVYTCAMHPQIEEDHRGVCPICGMTLELKGGGDAAIEGDDPPVLDRTCLHRRPAG
jgi:hypothetical protein